MTQDELIKGKLMELAGDGDILEIGGEKTVVSNGLNSKSFGLPEGSDKRSKVQEKDEKKSDVGLNLSGFSSSSDDQEEIVDAVDVEGVEASNTDSAEEIQKEGEFVAKIAYEDRKEDRQQTEDNTIDIETRMKNLGMSKDEAMDLIFQLTDDGYIEESYSFFKGRIKIKVRSASMGRSTEFMSLISEDDMESPIKIEFFMGLFSLAAVLVQYNDTDLSKMSVEKRVEWIEENIATILYKIISEKVKEFHEKIDILGSEEVANFF